MLVERLLQALDAFPHVSESEAVDWYDEAHHLSSFRPARIGTRLNIGLRQLYPLLTAEQLQQHQDALVGAHPSIEAKLPRERALQDPHLITRL